MVAAGSKQARVLHSLEAVNQLPQSANKPKHYIAYICHELIAAEAKAKTVHGLLAFITAYSNFSNKQLSQALHSIMVVLVLEVKHILYATDSILG